MTVAAYFELIEVGCGRVLWKELRAAVGEQTHEALMSAGLVRPGPLTPRLPCDKGPGRCFRQAPIVGPAPPLGGRSERVALCSGECDDGDPCPPLVVTADDLAQDLLSAPDLARLIHALYLLDGSAQAAASEGPDGAPVLLGRMADEERGREVFLALRPGAPTFAAFLVRREKVREGTLVLVPTGGRIPSECRTRYAHGDHVEIEVLATSIAVRGREIVRAPRLRVVGVAGVAGITGITGITPREAQAKEVRANDPKRPRGTTDPGARSAPSTGIAAEIGATSWEQITITVIDGHTVRIHCGKASVRRTYLELGFAGARREPTEKWKVLLAACAGHGSFSWRKFGNYKTAKNSVSVVRNRLKEAFGLESDPFRKYTVKDGWRVSFFAKSEIADDDE